MTRRKPGRRSARSLYVWHRYLGGIAAVFLLLLAFSGIALNHPEELGLDETFMESEWLLDTYGIRAPDKLKAFPVGDDWAALVAERVYVGGTFLPGNYTRLAGAVDLGEMSVIAVDNLVLLATREGELIDKLDGTAGVPAGISALGLTADGRVAARASHGVYLSDRDLLGWEHPREERTDIRWSVPGAPPESFKRKVSRYYRAHALSMERVLLDLHSGRAFGPRGPLLMDFAALVMIFLSLSGPWLWWRQARKLRRTHQRRAEGIDETR